MFVVYVCLSIASIVSKFLNLQWYKEWGMLAYGIYLCDTKGYGKILIGSPQTRVPMCQMWVGHDKTANINNKKVMSLKLTVRLIQM